MNVGANDRGFLVTRESESAEASGHGWKPVNPAHAIQNVFAAVVFAQPVPNLVWNRLHEAGRKVSAKIGMSAEQPVQNLMVQFGGGAPPALPILPSSGVEFYRPLNPGFIADKLTLNPQTVRLDTWAYTRWLGFNDNLSTILDALLPILSPVVTIQQITLEYIDSFVATSAGDADSTEIVRPDSDCISRRAVHPLAQWHSHSGWFEDITSGGRTLINSDITVGDANTPEGIKRSVTIRTHQSRQFLTTPEGEAEAQRLDEAAVLSIFSGLHADLKARLGDILTPGAKAMVSLEAN